MIERLDWIVRSWSKVDQYLAELTRVPSETLREQMAFTPFVFEDVGALIDASADDLYLFSSDYPQAEGGKDPIGRFEQSLGERPAAARDISMRRTSSGCSPTLVHTEQALPRRLG